MSLDYRDKRLRTSIHIAYRDKSFVFDTGPDFRQQMLRANIDTLDAVIFTHEHKDHTAGMDDVRAFNFRQKRDMPVYAHERVIKQLRQEFSYVFSENKYPGVPRIQVHEITGEPFEAQGVSFMPIQVMHYKLPVYGYRIADFSYITDANYISEEEKEKIKGSKVLVLNALQQEPHISHYNLEEAIAIAEEIGAEKTYFLHISHRMGQHAEISRILPEGIELAHDGLKIEL